MGWSAVSIWKIVRPYLLLAVVLVALFAMAWVLLDAINEPPLVGPE